MGSRPVRDSLTPCATAGPARKATVSYPPRNCADGQGVLWKSTRPPATGTTVANSATRVPLALSARTASSRASPPVPRLVTARCGRADVGDTHRHRRASVGADLDDGRRPGPIAVVESIRIPARDNRLASAIVSRPRVVDACGAARIREIVSARATRHRRWAAPDLTGLVPADRGALILLAGNDFAATRANRAPGRSAVAVALVKRIRVAVEQKACRIPAYAAESSAGTRRSHDGPSAAS